LNAEASVPELLYWICHWRSRTTTHKSLLHIWFAMIEPLRNLDHLMRAGRCVSRGIRNRVEHLAIVIRMTSTRVCSTRKLTVRTCLDLTVHEHQAQQSGPRTPPREMISGVNLLLFFIDWSNLGSRCQRANLPCFNYILRRT